MIRHHSSYLLTRTSDYQRTECHPLGIAFLEVLAAVMELKMLGLEILEDHPLAFAQTCTIWRCDKGMREPICFVTVMFL